MARLSTAELIDAIGSMSLLEVSDLVKAMETHFGITAAAPVAAVSTGPVTQAAPEEAAAEPTEFTANLTEIGPNKINVIKAVRELLPSLGLKEAKDLVDGAPKPIKEAVTKEEAEAVKEKMTSVGATVTIVAVG